MPTAAHAVTPGGVRRSGGWEVGHPQGLVRSSACLLGQLVDAPRLEGRWMRQFLGVEAVASTFSRRVARAGWGRRGYMCWVAGLPASFVHRDPCPIWR